MARMWIRNEWILDEDDQWVQDKSRLCISNLATNLKEVEVAVKTWRKYLWVRSDDFVLGIPTEPGHYLVAFHLKEVR